jgi:RNA polymerase sigma-70 factor (ECF subfamily)
MKNKEETLNLNLIHAAQRGDKNSRAELAELIRLKVYAYHYRMTLDAHTAEDLCQETMVSLLEDLGRLTIEEPIFLWAWVYKTALNKIRNYYTGQRIIKTGKTQMKQILSQSVRKDRKGLAGPDYMIHQELLTAVSKAIDKLKLQYRNILTLRCFQELSYAEIAQVTGSSELGARLLFYRAKQSLTRQLARSGFSKSQLLSGLTLFAAATLAPTDKAAAVAVGTATIHTGLGIKLLTIFSSYKFGIGVAAVVALTMIHLGTFIDDGNNPGNFFHPVLETEIAQENLAHPTTISAAYNANQSGWRGGWQSEQQTFHSHAPGRITLEQWLADSNSPDKSWLLLTEDQWIEIMFNGTIIDGAGDDIFITERCCHGEQAEIYLTDNNGNILLLGELRIPRTGEHGLMTYGFDLAKSSPHFSPTAIRIKTTHNGLQEYAGAIPGLELQQVRARVQMSQ